MLLTVFEKYFFLQSLGWGIANSLWQVALLWMIYKLVTVSVKNLSALFKYHFSLMLLFASFAWFVSTTFQTYLAIKNAGNQMTALSWVNVSQNFINSLQWLSVAYFIVLAVQVFLFAKKINSLFLLKKSDFIKAPVDIRLFTEQTAFHIGIQKKVSIWLSEKAGVPSVIGFFKPIILFPVTALNNLTTAQAEAIILHELAHIKRHDYLVNFVQCFIEMILFFNPFTKMLGNAARKERENCCDDWVMNYQYDKHEYASALLTLEQNRFASIHFALAATNNKKNLLNRIKRLFADEPTGKVSFLQKANLAAVSCTILLMVLFVLPVRENKTIAIQNQETTTPLFASVDIIPVNYIENKNMSVVRKDKPLPVKVVKEKTVTAKAIITETPEEIEFNTALINEELLKLNQQVQSDNVAIQTAMVEEHYPVTKVIVKIEEEQSGTKDKKTYLVELKNNNGITGIKPLIMIDKKVKELTKKSVGKRTTSSKKTVAKKRTTA